MARKASKKVEVIASEIDAEAPQLLDGQDGEPNKVEQKDVEQGAIEVEQPPATELSQNAVEVNKPKEKTRSKELLRELFSKNGAAYTIDELADLTGRSRTTIQTHLYQLRTPGYCGKGGLFVTKKNDAGKYVHVQESVE